MSIVAAALIRTLPNVKIVSTDRAFSGFFVIFDYYGALSHEMTIRLEEEIRQIIREDLPIRWMEMAPYSASEWLKKVGQPVRAKVALSQEADLVTMAQFGDFVDLTDQEPIQSTSEFGFVRVLQFDLIQKNTYRIFAIAASSKKELQAKIRLWKDFPSHDHDRLGQRYHYWDFVEHSRIWLSSGLEQKRKLCQFWRKSFFSSALEVSGASELISEVLQLTQSPAIMEFVVIESDEKEYRGLLDQKKELALQIHFESKMQSSFLQTVEHSFKILSLSVRIDTSSPKMLNWIALDALRQEWVVATIEHCGKTEKLTVWIERNMALLLEICSDLKQIFDNIDQRGASIENK